MLVPYHIEPMETALPLVRNIIKILPFAASGPVEEPGVFKKQTVYLLSAEACKQILQEAQLMCDDHVRMCVKQRTDKAVPALGASDKESLAFKIIKDTAVLQTQED